MKLANQFKVFFAVAASAAVFAGAASALPAFLDKRSPDEQRQEILAQSAEILGKLYQARPEARSAIERAYGYATFSNLGVKIFLAGSGSGRGVAVNNAARRVTYMNMFEVQAGMGLGVKKFMLIWVFDNPKAFDDFVNSGWEFGGQVSAAAKAGDTGGAYQGAVQVASGVYVYQLTEAGLALELTAKGTKYYKDGKLNEAR